MSNYAKSVVSSLVGVFFGLLLVPGSIALHAWNEYRTVHREKGLLEASKVVVSLPNTDTIDDHLSTSLSI